MSAQEDRKRAATGRKHDSRKKKVMEDLKAMEGVGVLVLLPNLFVVKDGLSVPLSCHPGLTELVTTRNQDFCKGFISPQQTSQVVQYSSPDLNVVFPSCHMMVCFLADT